MIVVPPQRNKIEPADARVEIMDMLPGGVPYSRSALNTVLYAAPEVIQARSMQFMLRDLVPAIGVHLERPNWVTETIFNTEPAVVAAQKQWVTETVSLLVACGAIVVHADPAAPAAKRK